ncbi:hybrid sensor histidine kinase/response regulator [bacterium]|nr:hybrid sensor histidine kinase/response regulator [bacterium]
MTDVKGNLHTGTRIGRSPFLNTEQALTQDLNANTSELIHFISHEIDNPVTAIVSLASVLPRTASDQERISHFSDLIAQEAWKISRLTEKLTYLLSTRATAKVPCSLMTTVERVKQKLSAEKLFTNWQISIQITSKASEVMFEFHQLALLVRESIFIMRNIGELLQTEQKQIQITAESDNNEVIFSTKVSTKKQFESDLSLLFDCAAAESSQTKELSLALAVTNAIAQRFGCEFEIEEETTSTGFDYHLTTYLKKATASKTLPSLGAETLASTSSLSILIVDDEPVVATGLKKIIELSFRGAEVKLCSPEDAQEHLKSGAACALVLCDLHLPGYSGVNLRTELIELRPDLSKRILMMTGDKSSTEVQMLEPLVMYKPFDAETLILKIRETLGL